MLIIIAVIWLLPLWAGILTAFKTAEDVVYTNPVQPPLSPTLEPLLETFLIMQRPLVNSLIFTSIATILSCFLGSVCGFALTKIKFKGSNTVFLLLIIGIFIPYQAVLVPLVLTMVNLGLYNTVWGLILTHTAYGIPMGTPS